MADPLLIAILAYGHVLSAMAWLGGGILLTFVVGPNARTMTPMAGLEFNSKVLPKVVRFVQATILSTFFFGFLLLYFFYEGDFSLLTRTSQGLELTVGIVLALFTAAVVWSVTVPSFHRVIEMAGKVLQAGQGPPPPEMMKYGKRARQGSLIGISLLLIVLAMMIAAGFGLGF